ncbi:MAG: heat-inducible transcriptional repressor HrcA [Longimicrobiales bacterium]
MNLNEREERVLAAVIRTYVETAEPAGSRTVAKRHGLGVSPATIRNAMSDLEEKGFLFHPHTSAGRIPTDLAYRYYVDTLMQPIRLPAADQRRLRKEFLEPDSTGPLEWIIRRATQVLGLITGELGVAVTPGVEEVILEKLELALVSTDKMLLVLTLRNGVVRTVYVDVPMAVPPETLTAVTSILNERLAGRTLTEIRLTLPERLRDSGNGDAGTTELLNIFVQSADELLQPMERPAEQLHLGRTSVLANQPEFASGLQLKNLIELTEQRDLLSDVITGREHDQMTKITIGAEHKHPRLVPFTLVTSEYRLGNLTGVIGVIGPTRMPYEKVAAIVQYTSLLMTELAAPSRGAAPESNV